MNRHTKHMQHKRLTHEVHNTSDGFVVVSGYSGNEYLVSRDLGSPLWQCTCDWGTKRSHPDGTVCSHIMAVHTLLTRLGANRGTSYWGCHEDALRQHRPDQYLGEGVYVTTRKMEVRS